MRPTGSPAAVERVDGVRANRPQAVAGDAYQGFTTMTHHADSGRIDDARADESGERNEPGDSRPHTDRAGRAGGTSRRTLLGAIGAGAAVGLLGTGSAVAQEDLPSMAFVETDGTDLVVDGERVYFSGSNNFWITDAYADRQRVDDVMALFDDMGLNLVRTWTFCEGTDDEGAHCMQPQVGEHDEAALEHLDYVVAKAREHGIRLVLTFVDYWAHDGGMDEYVRASSTTRPESEYDRDTWEGEQAFREQFYADEECRDYYRDHVETILTRENAITGVEYRNEPAIAMWELANEPRGGQVGTDVVGDWFEDMSAFVKDLDDAHLLSTGMEGFYDGGRDDGGGPDWGYTGAEGTAYVDHHRIETIDVCSFHLYPDHWNFPLENGSDWIQEHVVDAHEQVGKPAYLGEFNVNAQDHDVATRNEHLEAWYDALDRYDADAATIWQVVLEDTQDHDGFQVYRSESGDIVEAYAERVRAKSDGDSNARPTAVIDADATAVAVDETLTFDAGASSDADGSLERYEWAFGDGTTATGDRVEHAFADPGEYDVALTVTDDEGATDTAAVAISVTGDGDSGSSGDLNAEMQPSTTSASVGERVTFGVEDTTGDQTWLTDLAWSFGDGTTATGWWAAHSYDAPGTYTVALTATDNEGTATTHEVEITVSA